MTAATPLPDWEALPWDTACFGFPTARLRPGLPAGALGKAVESLRSGGVRLAYWNTLPEDKEGLAAASALGGMRVDERVRYLADPLPAASTPAVSIGSAAPGRAVDATGRGWDRVLEDLAIHAGKYSRFKTDPHFPAEGFRALYREWMRKSLTGERADAVLVLPGVADPVSVVTLTARDGEGSIGLIAVAPGMEGRGLGSELMRASGEWFRARGCARASVVTQGANLAACALYERHGYLVKQREIVHHFWL
ncbi:MAG: GNAT family N-acetyltransferase [Fibrobacteres bacterium]|nr:GNAT family N-acetyltransferase [Fibrobacterota bacterium]